MGCYVVVMLCGWLMNSVTMLRLSICDAMWLCDVVNWEMMCCGPRRAHDSKALERSISKHGETMGCKTPEDYKELMSQYYDFVLQRFTKYIL